MIRLAAAILLLPTASLACVDTGEVDENAWFRVNVVDPDGPERPWGKAVGDIDADGIPDLVVGGNESEELVWYRGPDWTRETIAEGERFGTDVEVMDVDGDSRADVVTVTAEEFVWFRAPTWERTSIDENRLHDFVAMDLDLDGDVDFVGRDQGAFGNRSGATLFIYLQSAPGAWERTDVATVEGEGLDVSDLTGDGYPDLVINGQFHVNPGADSMRAWDPVVYGASWTWPHAYVAVRDISGDGWPDVVLAPSERAGDFYRISWFEHPGEAVTDWREHVVARETEAVHHFVATADFDQDGDVDIATAQMHQGEDPDEVTIYENVGDGLGWAPTVISTTGSHSMVVADIDLDGDLDLFGANHDGRHQPIEWYENRTCDPGWNTWRRFVLDDARPWGSVFVASADIDGDGLPDVLSAAWWYRNPGAVDLPWERHRIGDGANNVAAVLDVDADGRTDVLATGGEGFEPSERMVWARNLEGGGFEIHNQIDAVAGDFLQGVAVGAFGPEGSTSMTLSWHLAGGGVQRVSIPPDPVGERWPVETISEFSQDEALSAGDVDGDGDLDLVLGTWWLRNEGNDQWVRLPICLSCPAPDRNVLGDLDRDGRLDVVVGFQAISRPGPVAWFRMTDDPTAEWERNDIAEPIGPMSIGVGDIDLDGDEDLVVGEHNLSDPESARLLVYENRDARGGEWIEHVVYVGDEHHDGAHLVDIDLDGDLDVLSIGYRHDRVLLYENRWTQCRDSDAASGAPTGR